jgi:hypothetical protein
MHELLTFLPGVMFRRKPDKEGAGLDLPHPESKWKYAANHRVGVLRSRPAIKP